MEKHAALVIFILLMVALIIATDVLIFRQRFWERLMSNIGTVLIFAALYLRYLKQ